MCGITGFFSKSISNFDDAINKMSSAIHHRGPDSSGVWINKNSGVFFGHQRLSILDLSETGHQPMISRSGRYVITYNGEIYNHLGLRNEIEAFTIDIKWRGSSDTETLLEAIDIWGLETTLKKISGMFAFGLWDQKQKCLILVRDRVGQKPLYFGWQGRGEKQVFLFGSELKALKAHPEFNSSINKDAIALYLRHNCIPAPYSIYNEIYKLLPGHFLKLEQNDLNNKSTPISKAYWSLIDNAIDGNENILQNEENDIKEELEKKLLFSVKQHMISDVPLGSFLSGGIDSSLITALMQSQSTNPVQTFTIGFKENNYSEAQHAKKIANYLGTNHTELYVSSKMALDVIPKISEVYDEPFADSSQIPTYLISQLASKNVKVALTGDAGDELFCGYNRYVMSKKFSNLFNFTPIALRKILKSGLLSLSVNNWDIIQKILMPFSKLNNFGNKVHKGARTLEAKTMLELYHILSSNWSNPSEIMQNFKEPENNLNFYISKIKKLDNQQQMMVLDLITFLSDDILVKVDRAAMSYSLETRTPFLDNDLIDYAWKVPQSLKLKNGSGKWILKQILNKYVPNELMNRPKMGFESPIDKWLRGPLKEWADNLLNSNNLRKEGYINHKIIRKKWDEHLSGKKNWQYNLWNILMFEAWLHEN